MGRFIGALADLNDKATTRNPITLVREAISRIVCEDITNILRDMGRSLDTIELELHNDETLQKAMPMWREQLGKWKNALFHQGRSIKQMMENSAALNGRPVGKSTAGDGDAEVSTSIPHTTATSDSQNLERKLKRIGDDVKNTYSRIESTFQALMSSITIIESKRAIKEAESVSRLSQLAFFFIPLSLVASLFGINVNVSATSSSQQSPL